MNDSIVPHHALSGVLHGLFLVIAFLSPVAPDLGSPIASAMFERVATSRIVETMPRPTTPRPAVRTERENLGKTNGRSGGMGQGRAAGEGPKIKIRGDEPVEPSLKQAPTTLAEDVSGLLAGFTNETIGDDATTALGQLDDGGGGGPAFVVSGFGIGGGGASCWSSSWKQIRTTSGGYKRVVKKSKKTECRKAQHARGLTGIGTLGGAVDAKPNLGHKLGDCDGQECVNAVALTMEEPRGCDIVACPWKEIIGNVITRHLREVESCYDDALRRRGRGFSASLTASFRLPPTGGSATVALTETSGVAQLDACVKRRADRWIFPETGEQIVANYPFRFEAI